MPLLTRQPSKPTGAANETRQAVLDTHLAIYIAKTPETAPPSTLE
jgi:hypothetical protein